MAFIPDPANGPVVSSDGFAEDMGKEFVSSATSGEEATADDHDAVQPEEVGGPFVETTSDDEMGMDEDEEGTVEAVPTTSRSTRGR